MEKIILKNYSECTCSYTIDTNTIWSEKIVNWIIKYLKMYFLGISKIHDNYI